MAGIWIRTSMDIPLARTLLRKRMRSTTWSPNFLASASAVITLFSEIAVSTNTVGNLSIINLRHGIQRGVELRCTMPYSDTLEALLEQAKSQLVDIVNEVTITNDGKNVRASALIWSK